MSAKLPLAAASLLLASVSSAACAHEREQPRIASRQIPVIEVDGLDFRDLNRSGTLDPYEDWRKTPAERADDLLARMTLPEKVGQMVVANLFNDGAPGQPSTGYVLPAADGMMQHGHVGYFVSSLALDPVALAKANNNVQELAEAGRLGIPVVLATDPRHHFQATEGASVDAAGFSRWPEAIGLGAIGDAGLVKHFADVVRRDYRATGFTLALSPQADLATEPRWPRINGTFGEDADSVAPLVAAYVEGLQGGPSGVEPSGVAAVVKHFVGYGAAKDGWDAHNRYGRYADLDAAHLPLHLKPFEAAFAVRPSGVMPSYAVLSGLSVDGKAVEPVGAAFSQVIVGGLLRGRYGFDGVVLSDWAVTNDCGEICMKGWPEGEQPTFEGLSMAWGVEDLTQAQRFAKAIKAGVDQFGGVMDPSPIAAAVEQGLVSEAEIDTAVRRILTQSFGLGVFEAPFVDADEAGRLAGAPADRAAARAAQARAMVLLENAGILPLANGRKVFLHNADRAAAEAAGFVPVDRPEDADFAVFRLAAPFEKLHPNYFFGSIQHEGSLAFPEGDPALAALRALPAKLPVVIDVYLDRPAVLTPLRDRATALIGDFGASDAALFDVLAGKVKAEGRLPFELPSSMQAVEAQKPGVPADSAAPLYPLHYRKDR